MAKRYLLYLQVAFYFLAGLNHFRKPVSYYSIIPPCLPWPALINTMAGIAEIVLALGLAYKPTRLAAAYGIIVMLIVFIPAHIYFIQAGGCIGKFCFPAWVGWARLLVVQPLLIVWAWRSRNIEYPMSNKKY